MNARDELERLVHDHSAAVYRVAWRILRNDADAQDVSQDTFVRVAAELHEGRSPLEGVESEVGMLCSMAARAALDRLRRARHRREREEVAAMRHGSEERAPEDPAVTADREGAARMLDRELDGLAEDLRIALELRFREGLTFAAIGAATGISEPSAHDRVRRGLAALRGRLGRLGLGAFAGIELEEALARAADVPVPGDLSRRILTAAEAAPIAAASFWGGMGASKLIAATFLALVGAFTAVVVAGGDEQKRGLDTSKPALVRAELPAGPELRSEAAATAPRAEASGPSGDASSDRALDAEPASTAHGTLTGRVVDADGRGLPGVRVHAFTTERAGKPARFERIGASGAQGAFELQLPIAHAEGQLYRVAFSHRDLVRHVAGPVRLEEDAVAALDPVALHANSADRPGEVTLDLLVLDEDDRPLAGAEVEFVRTVRGPFGPQEVSEGEGSTDDNGRITLSSDRLGAKTVRLDARRASPSGGMTSLELTFDVAGAFEETARVPAGVAIEGRVLAVDGTRAEGLGLWLAKPLAEGGHSWTDRVQIDIAADGTFRAAGLALGRYDLWGSGRGWSDLRLDSVAAGTSGLAVFAKRLDDPRDLGDHRAELHGVAVDAETGEPLPIEWLNVEVERLPDDLDEARLQRDAIPNRLLHSMAQVMVPAGGPPAATPEFHATGLAAGRYVITVFHADRAVGTLGPIELRESELRSGLSVPVPRGATVAGVILGPNGLPAEGAWLVVTGDGPISEKRVAGLSRELEESDGRQRYYYGARARTGPAGVFRLEHLPPGMTLRLAAIHADFEPAWSEVMVLADGEARGGVTLRLKQR